MSFRHIKICLLIVLLAVPVASASSLAQTPPLGWNSWDSYGTTVNEAQFRANAQWMADHLASFGWQYVVIDMEWFVRNPVPEGGGKAAEFTIDANGRYTPAENRFPSASGGAGFRLLADYAHSLGLRFGIHILQGIPRQAVEKNLPIEGSAFHAADAADTAGTCQWNSDNYDLKPNAAGQAYYDSIARLYAGWGVDFIKVDCIASRPYKGDEIRMLRAAIDKAGRPVVLSLSPGAAPLDKVEELRRYAQQWRISDDVWDLWHSTVDYPQGLGDQFPRTAKWAQYAGPGHWPDSDMLPLGYLGPAPGWGKEARASRLTHDEQRTLMTLWCIARSPLMMGGDLPQSDAWTIGLLTNPAVLAVNQHARASRAVIDTADVAVWVSEPEGSIGEYIAAFNLSGQEKTLKYTWKELGIQGHEYQIHDLWEHKEIGPARELTVTLAPHASVLYQAIP